jgi:hypothetical protein
MANDGIVDIRKSAQNTKIARKLVVIIPFVANFSNRIKKRTPTSRISA